MNWWRISTQFLVCNSNNAVFKWKCQAQSPKKALRVISEQMSLTGFADLLLLGCTSIFEKYHVDDSLPCCKETMSAVYILEVY